MHYYKRNVGDYHKKAGRLSMLEHGAYTLLMDACYDREDFPSSVEEAIDWCWARTEAEAEAVRFVLTRFFTLKEGGYCQKRMEEEIAEYRAKAATNSRIAKQRESDRREKKRDESTDRGPESTDRDQPVNDPSTKDANSTTSGHLTINQEPLTSNPPFDPPLEPDAPDPVNPPKPIPTRDARGDEEDEGFPMPPKAPKTPSTAIGERLTRDWKPGESAWTFAVGQLGEKRAADALEEFFDYWTAVPGSRGRKLDWDATFRNSVRSIHAKNQRPLAGSRAGVTRTGEKSWYERELERSRSRESEAGVGGDGGAVHDTLGPETRSCADGTVVEGDFTVVG